MSSCPKKLTLVAIENYHEIITGYIKDNEILISEYDDMTECVLKMIREGYCFNMDKNLLRGFLEDLTYMYSPNDEKNKDRIVNMLEESDEEDSDDEESCCAACCYTFTECLAGCLVWTGRIFCGCWIGLTICINFFFYPLKVIIGKCCSSCNDRLNPE